MLLRYTVTPQSMTEVSPVELMFGRKLRTILNLLQSDLENRVRQPQAKQKQNNDAHFKQRNSEVCRYVYNDHRTPKWLPGTIK